MSGRISLGLVFGLLLAVLPPAPVAHSATITVTTQSDELTTNGQCSLREAIRNANSIGVMLPDCTSGNTAGADTIVLPAGTFILQIPGKDEENALTGDLDVIGTATVVGQGAGQTTVLASPNAGQGIDRVFDVGFASHLTLRRIGIGNGNPTTGSGGARRGGAIRAETNNSTLTVEDVEVFDSVSDSGGGIHVGPNATANLLRTTISGSISLDGGGGISTTIGTVSITSSTIRNNRARDGGGIASVGGNVTVSNSSIFGNVAARLGGGILSDEFAGQAPPSLTIAGTTVSGNAVDLSLGPPGITGLGAGIAASDTTTSIVNSTISGNSFPAPGTTFGGGVFSASGPFSLVQSTVAFNAVRGPRGGGLRLGANPVPVVRGSIVAKNVDADAPAGNNRNNCANFTVSSGFNLTDSPANSNDTCGFTATTDLNNVDPQLGLLQDNGGPTQTHALPAGSPAIDRIASTFIVGRGRLCNSFIGAGGTVPSGASILVDQRGQPRVADGDGNGSLLCDVGAFERAGSGVGITSFTPADTTVQPGGTVVYTFPWEVPPPKTWHDLARLELRFRDAQGVVFHLRWNEANDTFQLVNPDGSLGPPFPGGANQTLQTPFAALNLNAVRTAGTGPTGPLVTLTVPVTFSQALFGRTLTIEALAVEDNGAQQGFFQVGQVTVGTTPARNDPNNDDEPKDQPPRLTEEQRQQRARTNAGNKDDEHTEGEVLTTRCSLNPPEVDIASRDGTVTLLLRRDAKGACSSLQAGDYVEADGEKVHEQRYWIDTLEANGR